MISQLSEHFSLKEATDSQIASRLGIDNFHPDKWIVDNAIKTATRLEKVRATLGQPMNVGSWIRCQELNRALKSKDTSQHMKGEAVDFTCHMFGSPVEICKKLVAEKLLINFDQLILEHTWVHISWNSLPNSKQRGEVLSLLSGGDYAIGLTDAQGKHYD
jgi:putative chitinase